jgi:glycosyltransferase involved in cell wall biosynthesis
LNTLFKDERFQSAYDIAQCFKSQGEYTQGFMACDLAEKIDPRRAELFVLKGQMYFQMQDWLKALKWFEKAARLPVPQDVLLFLNPKMYFEIPNDYAVLCLDKMKEYRKAGDITKKLLDANQRPPDVRIVNNMSWLNKQKDKIIFFALGPTPENVWGSMMEEVGCGGLEQTFISLPVAMAARGHTVFVFCKTPQDNIYKGVYFVQYEKLATEYKDWRPDIVISSRWWDSFYLFPESKKIQWAQDAHYPNPSRVDGWATINAFVCSSEWHKFYTAEMVGLGLDVKKINVIPLSINPKLFENKDIKRIPKQVIYGSNPSRGLDVLQSMWKELSNKIPDITLKICYGWEGLKTWSGDVAWLAKQEEDEKRIRDWAKESGNIEITGRLTKDKFANEILSSSLCLYPCTFPETYCLVSLEMQAGGVPSVSTQLGALSTTLSDKCNILLDGNPFGKDYQDKFIHETIQLLNDTKRLHKLSKECVEFYHKQLTWEQIAGKWEGLIYGL